MTVQLQPGERADVGAARVLRSLLAVTRDRLPGVLEDADVECLHDLRVSVRRTRAMQRELKGVFPPAPLSAFRNGFRWLQQLTGPTRDLDVQLLEFEELPGGLEPLRELLVERRREEYARMIGELRGERTATVLDGWQRFIETLEGAPTEDRPDALVPVEQIAGRRIWKVYRRMVKMGRKIEPSSPPQSLHDLRKKGKELRYLLEFFASLYPEEAVKPAVKRLKGLQETLGRFQDREVQIERLRCVGEELAAREGGAKALVALGAAVEQLEAQRAQAREEFGERFAAFADSSQRKAIQIIRRRE